MIRSKVVNTINNINHDKIIQVYNKQKKLPRGYLMKKSDPWCAATVSAVFLLNGYDKISECSCVEMVKKAQNLGIWVESDSFRPSVGDVVLYDWQDTGAGDNTGIPDHVGIVIAAGSKTFTVREGNKMMSVGNRTLDYNAKFIRGFITPPYEKEEKKVYKTVDEVVLGIIKGEFGNYPERKENIYNYFQEKVEEYYKLGGM